MKSLYKALIEAGYPEEEMFHWQSDLYVFVTPLTTRIVEDWCKENGFDRTWHCPIFKDNVAGRAMYDCAFCYEPFFSERNKGVSTETADAGPNRGGEMKWLTKEKPRTFGGCMLITDVVGNMNLLNTPENRQISERKNTERIVRSIRYRL